MTEEVCLAAGTSRKKVSRQDLGFILLTVGLAIAMAWPLFGRDLMQAHDIRLSFIKTVALYQAWLDGDLLGRWIPQISAGFGYPVFNFYAPLFSYGAAALAFLSGDLPSGFNSALALTVIFSGLSMYLFAREFWGPEGGFLSAVAYLFAPYHIVDVYVRGACAESTAFVFFPLVMLFLYRNHRDPGRMNLALGAVSVAGMFLSHNVMAELCLPLAVAYMILLCLSDAPQKRKNIFLNLLMVVWGLGLSAYFWLPAIAEKHFVWIDRILASQYNFGEHFPGFWQLLVSPWGFDYRGGARAEGMSFQIGPVQLLLAILTITLALKKNGALADRRLQVLFGAGVFGAAVFFMLRPSSFLWSALSLCRYMNFPWRFLAIVTLAVSVLAGGAVGLFRGRSRTFFLVIVTGLLFFVNFRHCHPRGFEKVEVVTPGEFLFRTDPRDSMELLPVWVQNVKGLEVVRARLRPLAGKIQIFEYDEAKGLTHRYFLRAAPRTSLAFQNFYFPGWKVYIDGRETWVLPESRNGLVSFEIPPGFHHVMVRFEETPLRLFSDAVSAFALALLLVVFIWRRPSRRAPAVQISLTD
ncbi:MAG TPA: 6-pyruvoyl-tetrahydropterin synthase-related protein [Candidatus Omnitrophota bacterium]|nr:6-pyruvoyl-tetrahydropterin synthase-related protein [Candidatus Omnitrophota bacterium]HPS37696.1 6-pyruvoyl-tetrahydropterin synthase-related protein [Candidatus Omnitrophota bacterium]